MTKARYWRPLPDGRIECYLCPRECRLRDGQRGFCFVRAREGDSMVLTTDGRSSGFCIDPIEKKPLNHFLPGTSVLSFGTAGCNLGCQFCQNWDISKARAMDRLMDAADAAQIARTASEWDCESVAFTYNDPVIFAEYAIDVADACRERGIRTVAVSAGYVNPEGRRDLYGAMDAANIDLKAFTEEFYFRITGGAHLRPVLDALVWLKHSSDVWFEITTLLIPGHNDSDAELGAMAAWIVAELGPDVPHHFSAFHPDHRMRDVPPTPRATLRRARQIALAAGERYVYTGNVRDPEGQSTRCAVCGELLIGRDRYSVGRYRLRPDGSCPRCRTPLPGVFAAASGGFGSRRIPISITR
ncbi:MAG: AmmeMemoRadiSam system radical SAM enzyme [Propionibacteriaceae bacterium]|nr:AmmeMemoRadiSam system radical SAM enzyme [Propionibacteriaceae bacterium]